VNLGDLLASRTSQKFLASILRYAACLAQFGAYSSNKQSSTGSHHTLGFSLAFPWHFRYSNLPSLIWDYPCTKRFRKQTGEGKPAMGEESARVCTTSYLSRGPSRYIDDQFNAIHIQHPDRMSISIAIQVMILKDVIYSPHKVNRSFHRCRDFGTPETLRSDVG
jgi:hypothetical protein